MKCLKDLSKSERDTIQLVLDALEVQLQDYNDLAHMIDSNLSGNVKFVVNYAIERTVAYFATHALVKILNDRYFDSIVGLSEINLDMVSGTTKSSAKDILNIVESANPGDLTKKIRMIPDTLLEISLQDVSFYTFIEYKVDDSFKYFKLADDLIKYVIYTQGAKVKSYFMYVLFSKDDYVTISPTGKVNFQILQNKISKAVVDFKANVFLYDNCPDNSILSTIPNEDLYKKHEALNKIENYIKKIDEIRFTLDDILEAKNLDENPYYNNVHLFGKGVITANIIKDNYIIIKNLREIIISDNLEFPLQKGSLITVEEFKSNDLNQEEFVNNCPSFFNNQIKTHLKKGKEGLSSENYNVTYKRAYWILGIILVFCEINNITLTSAISNYNKVKEKLNETIENQIKVYGQDTYKKNLNSLALSLIHYLYNLYSIIFVFNGTELTESKGFIAFKKKKELLEQLENTIKIFKDKKKKEKLDWNFNAVDIGKQLIENIIDINDDMQ